MFADMRAFFGEDTKTVGQDSKRKRKEKAEPLKHESKPPQVSCFHCLQLFDTIELRNQHFYDVSFANAQPQAVKRNKTSQLRQEHVQRILKWTEESHANADIVETESDTTTSDIVTILKCLTPEGPSKTIYSLKPLTRLLQQHTTLCKQNCRSLDDLCEWLKSTFLAVGVDIVRYKTSLVFVKDGKAIALKNLIDLLQPRKLGLDNKLHVKWTTSWEELQARCMRMWGSHNAGELVLALCLTTGCRRKEILDSSIGFSNEMCSENTMVVFGTPNKRHCTLELNGLPLLETRMLCQVGVAKDKNTHSRVVYKPSLFLNAVDVVKMIQHVRELCAQRPITENHSNQSFRKHFEDMVTFGNQNGTHYSAHAMRGLYSRACYGMFVRNRVDEHVFTASVLGHGGDLKGSIHYLTTRVDVAKPWYAMSEMQQEQFVFPNTYNNVKHEVFD